MTKLRYELANGTVVKTYEEALSSGQRFSAIYVPEKHKSNISRIRQAILKKYGYVKPKREEV